jgi:hypothetical protein
MIPGRFLRWNTSLPVRLSELAIIAARFWRANTICPVPPLPLVCGRGAAGAWDACRGCALPRSC